MSDLNKVLLSGRLVADPEMGYTQNSQTAKTRIRMAVNRKYKDSTGEIKEEATFVTVTAWGKLAETCAQYLKKGSQVAVDGRLRIYSMGEGEEKKYSTEVVADNVVFLGSPKTASAASSQPTLSEGDVPF